MTGLKADRGLDTGAALSSADVGRLCKTASAVSPPGMTEMLMSIAGRAGTPEPTRP